jgi:hypothetical protein
MSLRELGGAESAVQDSAEGALVRDPRGNALVLELA